MTATSLNCRVNKVYPTQISQNTETHRSRLVCGRTWDMQILYIKGEGYQATYFDCVNDMMWSDCQRSAELAALELDQMVDRYFGVGEFEYVKIGYVPKPIKKEEVEKFNAFWKI